MAHVEKYNIGSVVNLMGHYKRWKDESGNYIEHINEHGKKEHIDSSKTHLNYNAFPEREIDGIEYINQRKKEVHCSNRKDVVVMIDWIITAPRNKETGELLLSEEEQKKLFELVTKFTVERYGEKNILGAYVHLDERTPHIHIPATPVTMSLDKRSGKMIEKFNAKELINLKEKVMYQKELSEYLNKEFGRDIGILNGATKEQGGNKSVSELKKENAALINKRDSINQEIDALNTIKETLAADIELGKAIANNRDELTTELASLQAKIVPLRIEYDTKSDFIKNCQKVSEASVKLPDYAKVSRPIFGGNDMVTVPLDKWTARHVSANILSDTTKSISKINALLNEKMPKELQETIDERDILKKENPQLRTEIRQLKKENKELRSENSALTSKIDEFRGRLERIRDFVKDLPGDVSRWITNLVYGREPNQDAPEMPVKKNVVRDTR